MSSRKCDITAWDIVYAYMIDENFRVICSNVLEWTSYYRGSADEIFKDFWRWL